MKIFLAFCFLCNPIFAINITLNHVHGQEEPQIFTKENYSITLTKKNWHITETQTNCQIAFNTETGVLELPDIELSYTPTGGQIVKQGFVFLYEKDAPYAKMHVHEEHLSVKITLYTTPDQPEPTHTFIAFYEKQVRFEP